MIFIGKDAIPSPDRTLIGEGDPSENLVPSWPSATTV